MGIYDEETGPAKKLPPAYIEAPVIQLRVEQPAYIKLLIYIVSAILGVGTVANGIWGVFCVGVLCIIGAVLFM